MLANLARTVVAAVCSGGLAVAAGNAERHSRAVARPAIEHASVHARVSREPPPRGRDVNESGSSIATVTPLAPRTGGALSAQLGKVLDNGVIRLVMNDLAPIVTQMWVAGLPAVPHDNIGADLQMSARSSKGDGYNPTQGGDCRGTPSVLRAIEPWNGVDPTVPAAYGTLLDIAPRNYNEPSYPGCLGVGDILPYDMRFAVTLGDGRHMPKELMLLDMSIRKQQGSTAEDIVKGLSELPVIYFDNTIFRYAYYSVDSDPLDGQDFQPFRVATSSGTTTNDTQQWPVLTNYPVDGLARVLMLCTRDDATTRPQDGLCVAIYSHEGSQMQASRRNGAIHSLTALAAIGGNEDQPLITDFDFHTQRRLVVVGNPDTVASGIAWAETWLKPDGWQRW
jgi:hypothetical protein